VAHAARSAAARTTVSALRGDPVAFPDLHPEEPDMVRTTPVRLLALVSSVIAAQAASAQVSVFTDRAAFLAATGATNATGTLPDLGMILTSATIGTVTFGVAPGGDNLAIGGAGVPGLPTGDWYPESPGHDIALGYENLRVDLAAAAYSMGFDLYEPDATMPAWGGSPVDSTFRVTLFSAGVEVAQFEFNVPEDEPAFVGVWSTKPFDSATIVDVTDSIFVDDDEYFGEFYTGDTPLPPPACYPNCDGSTAAPILNVQDFACFLNAFASQDPYANCDGSTATPVLNVQDFACFLNAFAAGCT
jgi:hypothetical protein